MGAIFGIRYFCDREAIDDDELVRMGSVMAHRGVAEPYLSRSDKVRIGCLKSRRDIGHTTTSSVAASDVMAVLDGRIYSQRNESSDTHMHGRPSLKASVDRIQDAYRRFGLSAFADFNGDFAIAVWNVASDSLILARDRFGARPLYYFEDETRFIFASEIKAILEVVQERPSLNLSLLPEYLMFRYAFGKDTWFNGIKEVLPGECIVRSGHALAEHKYWDPAEALRIESKNSDDMLRKLFEQAVRRRVTSGEKIGANCSGGIDSGLVTIFACKALGAPIDSYTIGFEDSDWDERYYARLTAEKAGTLHHEIEVRSEEFSARLPELNWHNDEPLSDPNSVLVYLLANYSKQSLDLLLTGEGADEVALGYPRYNLLNMYSFVRGMPAFMRLVVSAGLLASGNRRLKKLGDSIRNEPIDAIISNSAFVKREVISRMLNFEIAEPFFAPRRTLLSGMSDKADLLTKLMLYECQTYMPASLKRLDKMNMAVGLETTTPFLDNDYFDYALGMPKEAKISLFDNKCALRRLASDCLPRENMKMPKSGFGVPIARWFRSDAGLRELVNELVNDRDMCQLFRKKELENIVQDHMIKRIDNSEVLWLIVSFYLWYRQVASH